MTAQIIALSVRRQTDCVARLERIVDSLESRAARSVTQFRTPGCPPPRDPPVWLPATPPVKRPKPTKTERQEFLRIAEALHAWARDLGVRITVHPMGGVA